MTYANQKSKIYSFLRWAVEVINNKDDNELSIRARIISGTFWNVIGTAVSRGLSLAATILTARFLGTVNYGELGIINSTIVMFSTFAGLGLGITCTKYIAEIGKRDVEKTGRIIGLTTLIGLFTGSIMAIALFFAAPYLATNTLNAPQLSRQLRIASIILLLDTQTGVQRGSLAGLEAFKEIARIGILQGMIGFPVLVGGAYLFGLNGAVWGLVINSSIGYILNKVTLEKLQRISGIRPIYKGALSENKVIWNLSIPSMFSNVMVGPVTLIGNTLLINTCNGYTQLGIFNAGNQWRNLLGVLPATVGSVLLPIISSLSKEKNNKIEILNIVLGWLIVIIIAFPLMAFPELIGLLYGNAYSGEKFTQSFVLLMMVGCILAFKEGIARKLIANDLMWWGFTSNLLWAALFIFTLTKVKGLGASGMAIAYVISYAINTLVYVPFYIRKKVVSQRLILSKDVIIIWSLLTIQATISIISINIWIRAIVFPIIAIMLMRSFRIIWNKSDIEP